MSTRRRTASCQRQSRSWTRSSSQSGSCSRARTPAGAHRGRQSCRTGSRRRTGLDPVKARSPAQQIHQRPPAQARTATHLHLLLHVQRVAEPDPPVRDANALVHHRLVRPLGQQGRDGVVSPVEDEEQRRGGRLAEVPQVRLTVHLVQHLLPELARHPAHALVPHHRPFLERQQHGGEALDVPRERRGRRREGIGRVTVERDRALGWRRVKWGWK
mgnify:CR=1 FL=1